MRVSFPVILLVLTVVTTCFAGNNSSILQHTVYAVWAQPAEEKTTTIQYAYKIDGSWSKSIQLPINKGLHVTPVIATDKKKNIWIIWIEQTKDENILRYAFIRQDGFKTGRVNNEGQEQSYAPAIVIDINDNPLIAWSSVKEQFADIYSSKWYQDGWKQPVMVNLKNESPDITPIVGLHKDNTPWVSWFGYVEKYKYVQFLAKWSVNKWRVDTKTLPSTDVKKFIKDRITIEEQFPEQAQGRLMGAIFLGTGKEIQSISERFVSFK